MLAFLYNFLSSFAFNYTNLTVLALLANLALLSFKLFSCTHHVILVLFYIIISQKFNYHFSPNLWVTCVTSNLVKSRMEMVSSGINFIANLHLLWFIELKLRSLISNLIIKIKAIQKRQHCQLCENSILSDLTDLEVDFHSLLLLLSVIY